MNNFSPDKRFFCRTHRKHATGTIAATLLLWFSFGFGLDAATVIPDSKPWFQSIQFEAQTNYAAALGALSNEPSTYLVEQRRGWLNYLAGNLTNSIGHYRAAIKKDGEGLDARLNLWFPLTAGGLHAEAEQEMRSALKIHPGNYYARLRLGTSLRYLARYPDAAEALSNLLLNYPNDITALLELGLTRASQGWLIAARAIFNSVLVLDPENTVAKYELANPVYDTAYANWMNSLTNLPPYRRFDAFVYGGFLDFDGSSTKVNGIFRGISFGYTHGLKHVVTGGMEFTDIKRIGVSDIHQTDATVSYANYSLPNIRLKAGGHFITTSDRGTDGGWSLFSGVQYYEPNRWDAGIDAIFTRFDGFRPQLNVYQLTPGLGRNLWQNTNTTIRADIKGNWVRLDSEVGLGRRNFFSMENELSLLRPRWALTAFGWFGEQTFGVRNGGFTVFNLTEKHRGGYGLKFRYVPTSSISLTLQASRDEFNDPASSDEAAGQVVMGMIGMSF